MKNLIPLFIAASVGCAGQKPAPETEPVESPQPEETVTEEPSAPEVADEATGELSYNWREGRTRVYLPLTSSICEQDDQAQPLYQVARLWRFDPADDTWAVVDVNSSGQWRIGCNAMLDLIDVFGFDLEPGTYAIDASLDGIEESAIFAVGPAQCDGAASGTAPEGEVAACVVESGSAEIRLVPDPRD